MRHPGDPPDRFCNRCDGVLWSDERETCRRCRSDKHPQDTFLRRAKFKIHARPRLGEARWILDGRLYDYVDALRVAQQRLNVIFYMGNVA